jgi:hypothetical protein
LRARRHTRATIGYVAAETNGNRQKRRCARRVANANRVSALTSSRRPIVGGSQEARPFPAFHFGGARDVTMPTLAPDRARLNPAFEAYRLSAAADDAAARTALDARVIAPAGARAPYLGLAQARARAARNHLALAPAGACALFVDAARRVVLVTLDVRARLSSPPRPELTAAQDAGTPRTRVVCALPEALTSAASAGDPELPSIMAASDSTWLVSDGHGALLALYGPPSGEEEATVLVTHDLVSPDTAEPLHFVIYAAAQPSEDTALALVVSSARIPKAERTPSGPTTSFTATLLSIPLSPPTPPSIIWSGHSTDAPSHAAYHAPQQAFLLLSPAPFKPTLAPEPPAPTADELAPVPRSNESLDSPPYQWTQTSDSVTITLSFPPAPALRASAFAIALTPTHVSVALAGTPVLPRAALWDGVSDSTWTFDPAAHVLALELEKAHAGTRWPRLFAGGTGADVPETLDPAQLAGIRDALDKHTADADALGGPVPSLARGEVDDELDADSAPSAHVLWLPATPGGPTPANDTTPVALLGTPLPGALAPDAPPLLLAKAGLDGLLFAYAGAWTHTATFPALAFVLASKRAAPSSHVFHVGPRAALALEPGDYARGAGNVYLYHGQEGRAPYGRQTIVRVGAGGDGGMLVGAGVLTQPGGGRRVLLALCEREVVALRGLLD